VDRISDSERRRIAELVANGASAWKLQQEVARSRYAIRRAVIALRRPAATVSTRSSLRLSLVEREEISRGLVGGLSLRAIASRNGFVSGRASFGAFPSVSDRLQGLQGF
jgi:hypothetical protein